MVCESPAQLGASLTSVVMRRAGPSNEPSGLTEATHRVLADAKTMSLPSGDHTGPSSPRVCSDRPGTASL